MGLWVGLALGLPNHGSGVRGIGRRLQLRWPRQREPSWTVNASGETTRNIPGINGQLAAIQNKSKAPELQLANLHGDIIAKAYLSETATGLASTTDSIRELFYFYTHMRRLAPYRRFLVTFTVVGMMAGFLVGWLMAGQLLAGVAEAALVAVALGAAFALLARLLPSAPPPSVDQAWPRTADADKPSRARTQDVRKDLDGF